MDELLRSLALDIPAVALTLIFVSAAIEYLFPPYPGDTLMLFGFLLAGHGTLPLVATAIAAIAGSVLGAVLAWYLGARLGESYFLLRRSERARRRIDGLRVLFRRHGPRLLLVNRFLPGVRGVFLYLAGMNRIPLRTVLIFSTISNLFWIALIAVVGLRIGHNLEHARGIVRAYSWFILIFLLVVILLQVGWRRWIEPRLMR